MISVIVFAKEPLPGQVKSRLTPPLSPDQAAALYTAFVHDICTTCASVVVPEAGDRKVLAAPGGPGPVLQAIAQANGFETAVQEGPDLGARMKFAISAELARGAEAVVLVGSDSPTLSTAMLQLALKQLRVPTTAAVVGPAGDGGYWLIGASRAIPDLFEGIPWSTGDVLAATLSRAASTKTTVTMLPFWYDVDEVSDLRMLAAHIDWLASRKEEVPSRTQAAIAALRVSDPGFFLA